jgi:hypothetical protein
MVVIKFMTGTQVAIFRHEISGYIAFRLNGNLLLIGQGTEI